MADQEVSIQGRRKEAVSNGTNVRNDIKKSVGSGIRVGVVTVVVIAIITFIYDIKSYSTSESDTAVAPSVTTTRTVKREAQTTMGGKFFAPVNEWSKWVVVPCKMDVNWWGDDPDGERFTVQILNRDKEVVSYENGTWPDFYAFRVRSNTSASERVQYMFYADTSNVCPGS